MKAARVRTESMAQRLSKKPISEGFELWDRGYNLGAMRLFIFKAETSPPFQLGPCLDAMGHLLAAMDEGADAKENFGYAAEKYELIQQPILAQIMTVRGTEANDGPEAALQQIQAVLQQHDPSRQAAEADAKNKAALARAYYVHADIIFSMNPEANAAAALADAEFAASLSWDRGHLAHALVGSIKQQLGDIAGSIAAFEAAITVNSNHLESYLGLVQLLQQAGDKVKALHYLDAAIAIHPRSAMIRDKAFLVSENGSDEAAIQLLDQYIANPPHEETEALVMGGATAATLLKAKAAILADGNNLAAAAAAATEALAQSPGDEEAQRILEDIQAVEQQQ